MGKFNVAKIIFRSLLAKFYTDKVAHTAAASLSECGNYRVPAELSLAAVRTTIAGMTDLVSPTPLGLHHNSAMARDTRDSRQLLEAALATQPQVEGGAGLVEGVTVQDEVTRLLAKVPGLLAEAELDTQHPASYEESLNTVLRLEVARYNNLISIVR